MNSKKVLLEELSKINKLIAFKPGQLINEQGFPLYTPYNPTGTIASNNPTGTIPSNSPTGTIPSNFPNYLLNYNSFQPTTQSTKLVDCTKVPGLNYVMTQPTAEEQQNFATQSGLNPNTPANQIFFCDRAKMNQKLTELSKLNTQNGVGNQTNNNTVNNPVTNTATATPKELGDAEGIKKFQDWLDINKAGWATGYKDGKLYKARGYGRFGPRTSKAWSSYGQEYLGQGQVNVIPGMQDVTNVEPGSEVKTEQPQTPVVPATQIPSTGDISAGL